MRRNVAIATTVLLIAAALSVPLSAAEAAPAVVGSASATTATDVFSLLTVAEDSTAAYNRDYFPLWIDANGDGCNTRAEVLKAESLVSTTKTGTCTIKTGKWVSWYDGATWTDASDVDIDHFVPLSEAWRSGAASWTTDERRSYANDLDYPLTLVAITDNVNESKGDKDVSAWLPPDSSQDCTYAIDWVLVKYRWGLTIDTAEQAALTNLLSGTCGTTSVALPAKGITTVPGSDRIAGADRYATSAAVADRFPSDVGAIFIASGANFPDALSAAPAAAQLGGPLLLTDPAGLPTVVKSEITRLNPQQIYVVGGIPSVSQNVIAQLKALGYPVTRIAGPDRFATSAAINDKFFAGAQTAYIATGSNFPDALSASAVAGGRGNPVILVSDSVPSAQLTRLGIHNAVIVGSSASVSSSIEAGLKSQLGSGNVSRLAGSDRYRTSSAINRASFTTSPTVYLATGTGFADALSGAALAAHDQSALYVVQPNCVPSYDQDDFTTLGTTRRVLLGGTPSLGTGVANLSTCVDMPAATAKFTCTPSPKLDIAVSNKNDFAITVSETLGASSNSFSVPANTVVHNTDLTPGEDTTTTLRLSVNGTVILTQSISVNCVAATPPKPTNVVHPGAFCAPAGATGVTSTGTPMVCKRAADGRNRWQKA